MSEIPSEQIESLSKEVEISGPQKVEFILKAFDKASYVQHQRIDDVGAYQTSFETADGTVDIYIPSPYGQLVEEDDPTYALANAVQVIWRTEEEHGDGLSKVQTRIYTVSVEEMEASYEQSEEYEEATWAPKQEDVASKGYYESKRKLGDSPFTEDHLNQVLTLLDTLN